MRQSLEVLICFTKMCTILNCYRQWQMEYINKINNICQNEINEKKSLSTQTLKITHFIFNRLFIEYLE
jgi:hypothetical protein